MIKKIHYKLNFISQVGSQPTIHTNCKLVAHIHFEDGRIFDDVNIDFDDIPFIKRPDLFNNEEMAEINDILNSDDGIWEGVNELANKIAETEIIKTIKVGE